MIKQALVSGQELLYVGRIQPESDRLRRSRRRYGIEFLTEQRREPRPMNYRLVPRAEPEAQRPARMDCGGTPLARARLLS